jgi:CubicO group peptidase (beta-lactamase class C family)
VRRIVLYILTLLLSAGLSFECQTTLAQSDLARRIDSYIHGMENKGFSGSILIRKNKAVILDSSYGRIGKLAMRPNERYWIASITKQFTSAAILKLSEEGKLQLSDSVVKFFGPAARDRNLITIQHLMTHTSGIPNNYAATGIKERSKAVESVLQEPLADSPGRKFLYSDDNYCLLAAIIEIASGKKYEEFVQKELFDRAGLNNSGFWGTSAARSVAPMIKDELAKSVTEDWGFKGAGGIFSTTHDLLRWYDALRGHRVLNEASLQQFFGPQVKVSVGDYAYGWFVSRTPRGSRELWTRGTEDAGANGIVRVFPDEGVVCIVLSHAGEFEGTPYSRTVIERIVALIFASDNKPQPNHSRRTRTRRFKTQFAA